MILYNVTVNVDNTIKEQWLDYMKTILLPQIMEKGYFIEYKIWKMLLEDDEEAANSTTYALQFKCLNPQMLNQHIQLHAGYFIGLLDEKFKGRYFAFRTLLEEV
jgi:hypothetical protein